jgi:hypothetical protein
VTTDRLGLHRAEASTDLEDLPSQRVGGAHDFPPRTPDGIRRWPGTP